jgi:hypothetical protein
MVAVRPYTVIASSCAGLVAAGNSGTENSDTYPFSPFAGFIKLPILHSVSRCHTRGWRAATLIHCQQAKSLLMGTSGRCQDQLVMPLPGVSQPLVLRSRLALINPPIDFLI